MTLNLCIRTTLAIFPTFNLSANVPSVLLDNVKDTLCTLDLLVVVLFLQKLFRYRSSRIGNSYQAL